MKRIFAVIIVHACFFCVLATAQSLDLTIKGHGISIGDSREVTGLRMNFRDKHMRRVNGINATIWSPREPARGTVNGLALGLPLTGGKRLNGIAIGLFGAGAEKSVTGLLGGLVGAGAGKNISGIAFGGIGLGAGNNISGIALGGIGLGSGGNMTGLMFGGIGLGSGGNITGISIGGIGVGSGGDLHGLNIGGFGVGAGGHIYGISVSLIGIGAGNSVQGITISGVGVGAGKKIQGITIAGFGMGAPKISGLSAALSVGSVEYTGVAIAPAYFHIEEDGRFRGVSFSAWNRIQGTQSGLTIGILNIANDLKGVQIGLLNIAHSNPKGLKVLPFFNADFN